MANKDKIIYREELKKYRFMKIPTVTALLPLFQSVLRQDYKNLKPSGDVVVEKFSIPSDGAKLPAALFSPISANGKLPLIVFFHGGGFVYPCPSHEFDMLKNLTAKSGCRLLFVDYRLAPKYKYPTALDDCCAAYLWARENAEKTRADLNNIIVAGDSAGGNLAAAVCLKLRDEKKPMPVCQILLYPFLDRDFDSESMKKYTSTPMCNAQAARKFLKLYTGNLQDVGEDISNGYLMPAEAKTLKGLPNAYIEIAEYDCLLSGGLKYAERLKREGVEVVVETVKGATHGYDIAKGSKFLEDIIIKRTEFILKNLK